MNPSDTKRINQFDDTQRFPGGHNPQTPPGVMNHPSQPAAKAFPPAPEPVRRIQTTPAVGNQTGAGLPGYSPAVGNQPRAGQPGYPPVENHPRSGLPGYPPNAVAPGHPVGARPPHPRFQGTPSYSGQRRAGDGRSGATPLPFEAPPSPDLIERNYHLRKEAFFRNKIRRNQSIVAGCVAFLLFLGGVIFPFTPKEILAKDENRALAQMPQLSVESWFNGTFASGFDSYFADQFPLRSSLIQVNRQVKNALTLFAQSSSNGVQLITAKKDQGGMGNQPGVVKPSESGQNLSLQKPNQQISNPESSTQPKATTKPTALALAGTEGNHDYETTSIVIDKGRAMEIFYFNEGLTKAYAERLNRLRRQLPSTKRLFSLVAPTAIAFYGSDDLRTGSYSTFDAIQSIYQAEDASILKVDAYSQIAQHIQDYLYFRTDHHWNGAGAYWAYVAFCQAAGFTPTPIEKMEMTQPEGTFLGTLYGYTDQSPLLVDSADRAEIYHPLNKGTNEFYSDGSMSDPIGNVLLDATVPQDNHYMLFSGGDAALALLRSENKNGQSILVVKDSFANAFVPYLMDHYEKVYIVDPRSFADPLIPFIEREHIDDVMVLNYTFATSNQTWLEGFDDIVREESAGAASPSASEETLPSAPSQPPAA